MHNIVFFYPEGHEAHHAPGHPERPERVEAICKALQSKGWWQKYPHASPLELPGEVLEAVHDPLYLSLLEMACKREAWLDGETYVTSASLRLALQSAGGAAAVAQAVWKREARRGFALTRPPGHHAVRQQGMGFCLLNNVALTAQSLVQSQGARRLAIVDLDLHHGNGTQDIFWKRGDVLFISTHQSPLYPGTGQIDETGEGPGAGATVNLPFPPGSGDRAYETAMQEVILPLLDRFQPEMILSSVGFDPHWRDPLGQLLLSAGEYRRLIEHLAEFADKNCQGRLALFLEGGYDLEAGAACACAVTAALLEAKWQDPLGPAQQLESNFWQAVIRQSKNIWGL